LYSILLGHAESSTPKQLIATLRPRVPQLANISQLFGRPKEESKKRLQSQTITLPDDTVLSLTPSDKLVAQALSDRLQIDEVQALILFRSFIYNVGLPRKKDEGATDQTAFYQDIVAKIEPFYYTERLFLLRVFLPLLRASQNEVDPNKEVAQEILPLIVSDGIKFVETLLEEYTRKRQEEPSAAVRSNPVAVAQWSLQNLKEQLVLLEVIFWSMWGYVPCDGSLLVKIYENAYASGLGKNQKNAMYMLDNESGQLLQDSAALWMLILIEVLELEKMAEQDGFEISARPLNPDFYVSSPESLERIHQLVTSHGDSQYACIYLAWTYVTFRLTAVASELKEIPETYRSFFASLDTHSHSYSRGQQSTHELMIAACLSPAVGLFNLMLLLLTNSPLFVTSVAWRTGSSVTDPNAIAFRSVFKGNG
jgi:nuclear pore complex protein Nup188